MRADESTGGGLNYYAADSGGARAKLIKSSADFDPRVRPWYRAAVRAGTATWSAIYADFVSKELQITGVQPVFDTSEALLGVLGSSFFFTRVNEFLRSLEIGKSGETFIMERSGELITTSTKSPVFTIRGKQTDRIKARQSENLLIRRSAQHLEKHFGNLARIDGSWQLNFEIAGGREFLQVTPLRDGRGLDWLIVVVIPEADFMGRIDANTRTTILLCIAALILAILVGVLTARWIVHPLLSLNTAAKALAKGKWEQTVKIEREDEVGELASSFNCMAGQLQKSFEQLQESEARLTKFLEAVPVGVGVLSANGKSFYHNRRAHELLSEADLQESAEWNDRGYTVYVTGADEAYPPDEQPIVRAMKGESSSVENMEVHRPERTIPIEMWGIPIFDDKGDIEYAIAAFQDITERKQAEAEREKFTAELFQLNRAYERFVSREFLDLLEKESVIDVQLGDQVEKEMSVLFSDIRGFTSLSETMTPRDNFRFINAYLSRMEPIISEYSGFIDKYIGDAIMALFPRNADDAVRASIGMLQQLMEYNLTRGRPGRPKLRIGIGIHTGLLMAGTVGGKNRMDGTVISDAVNIGARVEGLTKIYGTQLLITEEVYRKLEDPSAYKIRVIDRVQVKGKSSFVKVYEVFDADPPEMIELKTKTLHDFEQGYAFYREKKSDEMQAAFKRVLQVNDKDSAALVYLTRSDCSNRN
ncbi:MAG: HAMP domain-containing protein [Gammaproteobacteria bacterium]|nr:HAMP domain-containing protein [Gammaproteobacteria bacterium]